jgi:hypothetical protein
MNINFTWMNHQHLAESQINDLQAVIKDDIETRKDIEFKPCHSGPVTVRTEIKHMSQIHGKLFCSCGKQYCKFIGTYNADKIDYNRMIPLQYQDAEQGL